MPGFSIISGATDAVGLDADLCRAVAKSILGDPGRVRFLPLTTVDEFLKRDDIDLVFHGLTWKPAREKAWGIGFTSVSFRDGQTIAVRADDPARAAADLDGASVCVERDSIFAGQLRRARASVRQVPQPDAKAAQAAFLAGGCRGWSWDASSLFAALSHDRGASYRLLADRFSLEPLAPIVRAGDDDLAKVMRRVIPQALRNGELYRRHFVDGANVIIEPPR